MPQSSQTHKKMPLQITHHEQEGIQICNLEGSLLFGEADLKFRDEIDRLIEAGEARIILNLNHLEELDSTGLATLLNYASVTLPTKQGRLVLCDVNPVHSEMLSAITPEALLPVFHSEEDALDSLIPGRHAKRHYLLDFARSEELEHLASLASADQPDRI
jgi:anti-anti-sigma factor